MSALALLGLATLPAFAADKANQITGSISAREDRVTASLSYLYAVSGDIGGEGVIIKAGVANGDSDEDGNKQTADLLIGYQMLQGDWKLRTFGGITYIDKEGDGQIGFELQAQVSNSKKSDFYVSANVGYSSPDEQTVASLQLGTHFGDLVIGPELGIVTSPASTRTRLGLIVTDVKWGMVSMTFRGGYSFKDDEDGEVVSTPYLGASGTIQF